MVRDIRRSDQKFLKHPLSFKRNVCVILKTVEKEDACIEKLLRGLGVDGKFTLTSSLDIKNDMIKDSDTFIISGDVFKETSKSLQSQIKNDSRKIICLFHTNERRIRYKLKLKNVLLRTRVVANASDTSFLIKVGHTGMSASNINENIEQIFKTMNPYERFPQGWKSIKKVGLKTGSSEVVAIYESTDPDSVYVPKLEKRKFTEADWGSEANGSTEQKKKKGNSPGFLGKRKQSIAQPDGQPTEAKIMKKEEVVGNNGNEVKPNSDEVKPNTNEGKSLKKKKNKNKKGQKTVLPSSTDLVNLLVNQAKETVFSEQKDAEVKQTPEMQSKKQKSKLPKKAGKQLVAVQKGGELSEDFKQKLMASLQAFASGTEFEEIVVMPGEAKLAEAKENGSLTKNAQQKNQSPKKVNLVTPLVNSMASENGSPAMKTQKHKKKKNKSPKKPNLVTPLANGNPAVKENGSQAKNTQKKKNKKNKKPQVNLVSPLANGNSMVTKVVKLASPASKPKKKKSPKKAKVAAV